jgi:hypothetical protein
MVLSIPLDIGPSVAPSYFQALARTAGAPVEMPAITVLANVDQDVRSARLLAAQVLLEELMGALNTRSGKPGEGAPHSCDPQVVSAALMASALESAKRSLIELQAACQATLPR